MKKISRLWFSLSLFSTFLFFISCDPTTKTEVLPVLTTTEVSSIAYTTATCGGSITVDGGTSVLFRGVCWSINATPTIKDSKTIDGSGMGSFTSSIAGLTTSTTYFVRAYATTSAGTGYGDAYQFITKSSNIQTALIPAGTFTMGSPITEKNRYSNETQHTVTLSAFRMSKYEITNAQYAAFLNAKSISSNGIWATAPAYKTQRLIYASEGSCDTGLHYSGSQWVPVKGYENAPVINVSWYGATEYATYMGGTLPTEAQWEYACRAGTTTPFYTGALLTSLQANYNWYFPYVVGTNTVITSLPGKTQTVGTYAANAYGLYDMHGNVMEWCADMYDTYPTSAQTNPTGSTGSERVCRGGSWASDAQECRSAFRLYFYGSIYDSWTGFRVAFVP